MAALLSDVSYESESCYESETVEEDADGLATLPPELIGYKL